MIDVDHFKRFNDLQGHQKGDEVLRVLGHVLQRCCRAEDVACRYGGEEFLVLLPGAELDAACGIAERIRDEIGAARIGVTLSVGVAVSGKHGSIWAALLRSADTALYEAKHQGRDRVVAARTSPEAQPAEAPSAQ